MVNLKSRSCWLILLVGSKTRRRSRRGGRDLNRRFMCNYSHRQDKRRRRTCGRGGLGGSAPPAPASTSPSPAGHRGRLCTPPRPKSAARGRPASGSGGGGRPGRPARAGTRRGLRPARASLSSLPPPARSLASPRPASRGARRLRSEVPSARFRPPRPRSPRPRAQGRCRAGAAGSARVGGAGARPGWFARCRPRPVSCRRRRLGAIPASLLKRGGEQAWSRGRGARGGRGEEGPERDGHPGREGAPRALGRAAAGDGRAAPLEDSYFEIRGCPLRGAGCEGQVSLPLAVNLQYSL